MFDFCTNCTGPHNWSREDYDALKFVDKAKAVELTLCPKCFHNFRLEYPEISKIRHYAKVVDDFLINGVKPNRKS